MEHSFDIEIAKKYDIHTAILLKNLYFWIEKNRANGKHFYDGYYWTYNSKKAFAELFPYMTERQIDYTINKMEKAGLIIKGNYNKIAYDRTCWYAITKLGYSILQNCEMEKPKLLNGKTEIVKPIPDINTDINTNINTDREGKTAKKRFTPPTIEEVKEYCLERGNSIDPEQFVAFYESKGWKVGANAMKNWKSAVITWEKREKKEKKQQPKKSSYNLNEYEEMTQDEIIAKLYG